MKVTLTIPGAGKDWKKALSATEWILENSPDSHIFWLGLHSDIAEIDFHNSIDATAFKLRFPEWT